MEQFKLYTMTMNRDIPVLTIACTTILNSFLTEMAVPVVRGFWPRCLALDTNHVINMFQPKFNRWQS